MFWLHQNSSSAWSTTHAILALLPHHGAPSKIMHPALGGVHPNPFSARLRWDALRIPLWPDYISLWASRRNKKLYRTGVGSDSRWRSPTLHASTASSQWCLESLSVPHKASKHLHCSADVFHWWELQPRLPRHVEMPTWWHLIVGVSFGMPSPSLEGKEGFMGLQPPRRRSDLGATHRLWLSWRADTEHWHFQD